MTMLTPRRGLAPHKLAASLAVLLAQVAHLARGATECASGYPATCQADGQCITGCGSAFQRENEDQFCIPSSDPTSQICNDRVQNCCKANIGVILGVSIGIGAGVLLLVVVIIYFTGGGKADKSPEEEEAARPKEETDAA